MGRHDLPKGSDHAVTRLLHDWAAGDQRALERLMDLVYPELHRIAAQYLRRERQGHTLQPTALVSEAYLRLAQAPDHAWQDRTRFFAVAARVVRNILVDHARAKHAAKRGAGATTLVLFDAAAHMPPPEVDLLDLDAALLALERLDPVQSRIVELRYFAGLSIEETAGGVERVHPRQSVSLRAARPRRTGPPGDRAALRRRHDRRWRAVLRDGARRGQAHRRVVLRPDAVGA